MCHLMEGKKAVMDLRATIITYTLHLSIMADSQRLLTYVMLKR